MKQLLLAAALAAAMPAFGATVTVVDLAGNAGFADYSTDGLAAFDASVLNFDALQLAITFSAADIAAGQVAFNAQLANPNGIEASAFTLAFDGLATTPGTVFGGFDAAGYAVTSTGPSSYRLARLDGNSEYYGAVIGDPLAQGTPNADWLIATSGLTAGVAYGLEVAAVPEPAGLALLAAGLAALRLRRPNGAAQSSRSAA